MWKDLVCNIIYNTMQEDPKVFSENQAEQGAAAKNRKARYQDGQVGVTPNSVERKPKERNRKYKKRAIQELNKPMTTSRVKPTR